jgi:hypothetical protein
MMEERERDTPARSPAGVLTAVLACAAIVQAAGGLLVPGLYRDNAWVVSVFRATDWVTLVLVAPLLIGALVLARRGSHRAKLVMAGTTYYIFYNNLYYLLSAFNRFFLVYVAIFVLAAGALIAVLATMPFGRPGSAGVDGPRLPIAVGMLACAAILAVMWVGQAIAYVAKGRLPQLIVDAGATTHLVAALDLTLIVPPLALAAVWLWRDRPWGAVIATVMLVQCSLVTVALVVGAPFQAAAGIGGAWTMVPLWAAMGAVFLASAGTMLRSAGAWL